MPDAVKNRRPSIMQLDFERRALLAELDYGQQSEPAAQDLMRGIEGLDLAIAATPAQSAGDLAVKIERLAEVVEPAPSDGSMSIESMLLKGLLRDARRLAAGGG